MTGFFKNLFRKREEIKRRKNRVRSDYKNRYKISFECLEERTLLAASSLSDTENFLIGTEMDTPETALVEDYDQAVACGSVDGLSEAEGLDGALNSNLFKDSYETLTDAEVFSLHSLAGANYTIYLDFNGHTTSGTNWNATYNNGLDIVTPVFDIDGDLTSFSQAEREIIYEIWQRVSEDYLPFNINVTTEEPALENLMRSGSGDTVYGVRVCIGGSAYDWYSSSSSSEAGGVAYNGSFISSKDLPCFVFSQSLNNKAKYIAESAAHEAGHTLGLKHDGQYSNEYYKGTEDWAPVMGTGYYAELTQWSAGSYSGATNNENDLDILANAVDLRADDYSDTVSEAYDLGALTETTSVTGFIGLKWKNFSNNLTLAFDADCFSFSTEGMDKCLKIGGLCGITNLNVKVLLYDSGGNLLETFESAETHYVLFSLLDLKGTYFLTVEGIGCADAGTLNDGYGSLGAYSVSVIDADLPDLNFVQTGSKPAVYMTDSTSNKTNQTVFSSGKPIYVYLSFTNSGTSEARSYSVYLYYNDKRFSSCSGITLAVGETISKGYYVYDPNNSAHCSITGTGSYNFKAVIVSDDVELSKVNNTFEFSFEVYDSWTTIFEMTAAEVGANSPPGSLAGSFSVADPYNSGFSFQLFNDKTEGLANASFSISGNQLILESGLAKGTYTICVRAISSAGYAVEQKFSITVSEMVNATPIALLTVSELKPYAGTSVLLSAEGSNDLEDGSPLTCQWRFYDAAGKILDTILTEKTSIWISASRYADTGESFTVELTVFDREGTASAAKTALLTVQESLPEVNGQIRCFDELNLVKLDLTVYSKSGKINNNWTIDWGTETKVYSVSAFTFSAVYYYPVSGDYNISLTLNGTCYFLACYSAKAVNESSLPVLSQTSESKKENVTELAAGIDSKINAESAAEILNKICEDYETGKIEKNSELTESDLRLLALRLLESSGENSKKFSWTSLPEIQTIGF